MAINLSGVALHNNEINLLSRGLSFCPTPGQVNKEAVLDDLEGYFRRLNLKEFFLDEDDEEISDNAEVQTQFRPPSRWMSPEGRDASLETYIKKVRTDMERQQKVKKYKRCTDNLPFLERNALRNLGQCTDIVIKPANKGSTVVVLSKEDYIEEADRQLNNHSYYQKLGADPDFRYASEIKSFINSMFARGQIEKKNKNYLIPDHPRTARFYFYLRSTAW